MKIVFVLSLVAVLAGVFGCESHHNESAQEQQQESSTEGSNVGREVGGNSEKGGSAGSGR